MLQRHIAMARIRPDLARLDTSVRLEVDVNHHYEYVKATTARLPLYNPARPGREEPRAVGPGVHG